MSNEIDFEQFISVLDSALASDDPNVKKALRKFLFVAALAMGDDPEPGPFSEMLDTIDELSKRIRTLEDSQRAVQTTYPEWTYTDATSAKWIYDNGTTTTGGTGTTINTTPLTSGTTTITTGSTCTGFVPSAYSGMGGSYTINLGDDEKGKRIKKELKEKLGSLTK